MGPRWVLNQIPGCPPTALYTILLYRDVGLSRQCKKTILPLSPSVYVIDSLSLKQKDTWLHEPSEDFRGAIFYWQCILMPQRDLAKLFQLCLNETTLFKLQVRKEKKNSHVTGKKKTTSSISSCLPHLLLTQRMFISTYGGVNRALLAEFHIYFGLTSFGI